MEPDCFFEKIAVGTYLIKASFVSDSGTVFTITPNEQTVRVNVENASLTKKFMITGLTVTGRLVDFDSAPVTGAKVTLNGQTVDTNGNGIYKIENISPGIHKIRITKDDWLFDESEIQVRSSNPIIGDIKPTKVAVCPKSNSEEVQIQVYEGSGAKENFLTRFKSGKIDCMDLG